MSSPFSIAASSLSFAVLLIASPAAAQTDAAGRTPALPTAQQGASAEPAASEESAAEGEAEEEAESSEEGDGYVPEDEAAVEEEPAAAESPAPSRPSAPSAASRKANLLPQDSSRSGRIFTEVLVASAGLVAGGYAGAMVGSVFVTTNYYDYNSYLWLQWATSIGWMVGSGLALPLSVWVAGSMWQGKGGIVPTLVPGLIGMGIQLGLALALLAGGPGSYSVLSLIDVVGGVATMIATIVGYEKSNLDALRSAMPVARLLRFEGGGGVALAWAI